MSGEAGHSPPTGELAILDAFEVAVRGLSASWESAGEVAGRLAGSHPYEAEALALRDAMSRCTPAALIPAVVALRRALEAEAGRPAS